MADRERTHYPLWMQILVSLAASAVVTAVVYYLTGGLVLFFFIIFPLIPILFHHRSRRDH
jgi:hypothetical protein